jgi:hypothetical protein
MAIVSPMVGPNVAFIRPELAKLMAMYYLIRDCLAGEPTIKGARKTYLPMPDAANQSEDNKARYEAYILRAVFYNVTRRTAQGLLGQVFSKNPVVKLPSLLKVVETDATGGGVSLDQQSKRALLYVIAFSRAGLFVDYPDTTEKAATIADVENGTIRPTINVFSPMEVINWRIINEGAKQKLSLVVIYEGYCSNDDGFELKLSPQFKVLRLDDAGEYEIEIWRERWPTVYNDAKVPKVAGDYFSHTKYKPKGADGNPLREIPFMFIGSENNDANPDNPNMYDLASLNIAHYRNSADYEEACYIVGQPTPVLTGLTEQWYKDILGGCVNFGSRGGIPLPVGASADLLQASENTMIKEAMEIKERQMVALGAKLVEQKQVQRTAFETKVEATSEGSILSSSAKNVSNAFVWALNWCAQFIGQDSASIEFELNSDFDLSKMTPDEQSQAISNWQSNATTFEEMRAVLKKAGAATEDDEQALLKIDAEKEKALQLEVKRVALTTPEQTTP